MTEVTFPEMSRARTGVMIRPVLTLVVDPETVQGGYKSTAGI